MSTMAIYDVLYLRIKPTTNTTLPVFVYKSAQVSKKVYSHSGTGKNKCTFPL